LKKVENYAIVIEVEENFLKGELIMLKKKTLGRILLVIVLVIAMAGTSMAANYTCKVSLLGNKTEVKKGDSVTILVKASNIEAGEGIASLTTTLDYDANIFECTVTGDDDGVWQKQGLVENSLSMARGDLVANSSDQTIAKIVLKAKADAQVGKQTFKLTQIEFSTGEETFSVDDVSTTITITDGSGNNQNNTNTNKPAGNNTSQGTNGGSTTGGSSSNGGTGTTSGGSSTGSSSKKETSTSTKNPSSTIANVSSSDNTIPKTGVTDVLLVGAIIGAIATVIFYIKYKRAY